MKSFIFTLLLLLFGGADIYGQQTDTLYILQTTDVHGNINDYNYFSDQAADYGLARISSRVNSYRQQHKNVLLVDGGDLIQGTPLIYYFNYMDTSGTNPIIATMNRMQYDAFCVGNHDIEQGPTVYLRARRQSTFPWLSANSQLADGSTKFKPYTIIERNGIKIGILGITTPGIPMWLDKDLYPGITWIDMVKTAKKYAKILRPRVDILVGLFHAGFNASYSGAQTDKLGLPNENASQLVAEQVPGFDVVFAGHSHRTRPRIERGAEKSDVDSILTASPLLVNAGSWGRNLGVTQLVLTRQAEGWQVEKKYGWLESMHNVPADSQIIHFNQPYHEKTLTYIRRQIASVTAALDAAGARFADNPVVELINKAQLDYTGADISFAASFNDRLQVPAGALRIKDIYGMYRYENFLYTIEMSGQQIKDFLTYCARYYRLDENGHLTGSKEMAGYNYDMAEGLEYEIVVSGNADAENRVENLVLKKDGRPLQMDRIYTVAMNSYRATGGGGHLAAAGIEQAHILSKSNEEMRTILSRYIEKLGVIRPEVDGNWKVVIEK